MKHKRSQISPTCLLLPTSHKNLITIHTKTNHQIVHINHQLPAKIAHPFHHIRPSPPHTLPISLLHNLALILVSSNSVANKATPPNIVPFLNICSGLTILSQTQLVPHLILLEPTLLPLLHHLPLNDFLTLMHLTI